MIKLLVVASLFAWSPRALADEQCFELSGDGRSWSEVPELLCVDQHRDGRATVQLRSGAKREKVAIFYLRLLGTHNGPIENPRAPRPQCSSCNRKEFGLADPASAFFGNLKVQFDGTFDIAENRERGKVNIGSRLVYYRQVVRPQPKK